MGKKFIRKLTRASSHSYVLTVPKELVRKFRWKDRQKLEVIFNEGKQQFLVRDWKPRKKKK